MPAPARMRTSRNPSPRAPLNKPMNAPHATTTMTAGPSGADDLAVRERWLKQRRGSGVASRGLIAVWVAAGALVSWLFVAGFAGLGH